MYYPLSQIKTNLYTNGGEYVYFDTKTNYIGYYWKTSDGNYFSGKTPQDTPVVQLLPSFEYSLSSSPLNNVVSVDINLEDVRTTNYVDLQNIKVDQVTVIPVYFPTQPTQQDYQIGEFRRYFCKKTNEIQYIEISKDQFDLLVAQDPQILWQLYFPFFIPWDITGTREQVARVNKNIVDLTMKNLRLPRFNDYIKNDYTKYYR